MVSVGQVLKVRAAQSGLMLLASLHGAAPARAACNDVLPAATLVAPGKGQVTGDDLIRLRDIGQPDTAAFPQQSPLAISPDGSKLAFIVTRAEPDTNSFCRALVVIDLDGEPNARVLNRGGDLITVSGAQRGTLIHTGYPDQVTPAWSPDGQWIAFSRRDHGVTQLWRVRHDGQDAGAVTQSPVDVESFAWSADGHRLIYSATPGLVDAEKEIDRQGRSGWLNDVRMVTPFGARPLPPASLPVKQFSLDPDTGAVTPATLAEQSVLEAARGGLPSADSTDGSRAWTAHASGNPMSPLHLLVRSKNGTPVPCYAADCTGAIYKLWWDRDGRSLVILRREGWNKGQMGLLSWSPGARAFSRILLTDDVLEGCLRDKDRLICTSENAVTPRHLVTIDLKAGSQRLLFDPNPEFRALRPGTVTRLTWRNNLGLPAWGDLVMPPDYKPGTRLPLIITQYHSDGFLRGGTGDEYPIFAFAARGYAVLSLERPPSVGSLRPELHSAEEIQAYDLKDWRERRSLLSSLTTGITMVLARDIVDPARIGITGVSDGASATRFALVNTHLFAAAAISTCCTDTNAVMTSGGVAFADAMLKAGNPPTIAHDDAYWAPYSMTLAARRMDVPLLMQLADREMDLALETFTALREAGQPVEMYVFPDEHHNKWQPVHRHAVYERSLDWFDFWLRGKVDPDPAKAAQYARWEAMKKKRERLQHPDPDQLDAQASTSTR